MKKTLAHRRLTICLAIASTMALPLSADSVISRWEAAAQRVTELVDESDLLSKNAGLVAFGGPLITDFNAIDGEWLRRFLSTSPLVVGSSADASPLGEALLKALQMTQDDGVIVVFTDSVPDSEDAVQQVLDDAKQLFVFVQVGDDVETCAYLEQVESLFANVEAITCELINMYGDTTTLVASAIEEATSKAAGARPSIDDSVPPAPPLTAAASPAPTAAPDTAATA